MIADTTYLTIQRINLISPKVSIVSVVKASDTIEAVGDIAQTCSIAKSKVWSAPQRIGTFMATECRIKRNSRKKNTIKMLTVGSLLAKSLFTGSIVVTSDAQAYVCKGTQFSDSATKGNKIGTKVAARKAWQSSVKNQIGLSWSGWKIASNRSIRCHKTVSQNTCMAIGITVTATESIKTCSRQFFPGWRDAEGLEQRDERYGS